MSWAIFETGGDTGCGEIASSEDVHILHVDWDEVDADESYAYAIQNEIRRHASQNTLPWQQIHNIDVALQEHWPGLIATKVVRT